MKQLNIRLYKLTAILLSLLNFSLIYFDYELFQNKSTLGNSIAVLSPNKDSEIERFGYSDALNCLKADKNIKLVNISAATEQSKLIKIDAEYMGDIQSLYNSSIILEANKNFYSIENISITTNTDNTKKISFSLLFYIST